MNSDNDKRRIANTLISVHRVFLKQRNQNDVVAAGIFLTANVRIYPKLHDPSVFLVSSFNGCVDREQ
jgi:hypothetical protein